MQKNVFGLPLEDCGKAPLTGFYRDGCCNSGDDDLGLHTVCVIVTTEFLNFSALRGNDLSTPRSEFDFPGLKHGDQWCLCASRWKEAHDFGLAPKVILEATNEKTLEEIPLEMLLPYAYKEEEA